MLVYYWFEQIQTFETHQIFCETTLYCWSTSALKGFESFETYQIPVNYLIVASFPGPAQLSVTSILQTMESWAGPGNEANLIAGAAEQVQQTRQSPDQCFD